MILDIPSTLSYSVILYMLGLALQGNGRDVFQWLVSGKFSQKTEKPENYKSKNPF